MASGPLTNTKSKSTSTHPEDPIGCHNRGLVVDRGDVYKHGARETVLPEVRAVSNEGEVVSQGVTAVMDVGDVLLLHLNPQKKHTRKKMDCPFSIICPSMLDEQNLPENACKVIYRMPTVIQYIVCQVLFEL